MPYDMDEIQAAINLSLISPIPIAPKRNATEVMSEPAANPGLKMPLTTDAPPRVAQDQPTSGAQKRQTPWVSPQTDLVRLSMGNIGNDKILVSEKQRFDMAKEVYIIIRTNLPESMMDKTSLSHLSLLSQSIEKKLFSRADSYQSYLDLSTLKFRITALACAVLIYSEESGSKDKVPKDHSETFTRLYAAARSSLPHSVMVLVSFEMKQLGLANNLRV